MGVGAQHRPLGLHALWGLRAAGVVGGCPRGGWPATVVRGVWCQALSLPRPPVLSGGQPGSRDPCVPRAVGAAVGTQHRPHSVHSCVLWGRHEGARGGRLLPGCGASGEGCSPTSDLSSVRACGWGPLPTGCGCGGCGRGDPSPTPQRALLRAGFATRPRGPACGTCRVCCSAGNTARTCAKRVWPASCGGYCPLRYSLCTILMTFCSSSLIGRC